MSISMHHALARRSITVLCIVCLAFTALVPLASVAAQETPTITIGATATIASDAPVLLRTAPGFDAASTIQLQAGSTVTVVDGPVTAADGSSWYLITTADDQTGYVSSFGLVVSATAEAPAAVTGDVESKDLTQSADGGTVVEDASAGDGNLINGEPAAEDQTPAEAPQLVTSPQLATGSAVVAGTNGDGVRCRLDASYDAGIITVLPEGTAVELTGSAIGEWQPVNCAGQSGYVVAAYLSTGSDLGSPAPEAPSTGDVASFDAGTVSGYATVSGTNGDGVRCRTDASYDAAVITVLAEGTQVALSGGAIGEWQPVVCGGTSGYVFAGFLGGAGSAPDTGTDSGNTPDSGDTGSGAVSGYATVSGTNGDGVRCRTDASYDAAIITVLAEGTQVALSGGAIGEWQPVVCGGTSGYVFAGFLGGAGSAPTDGGDSGIGSTPTPSTGDGGSLGAGATAMVTSDLNLRYEPSYSGGVAAIAPGGTVVTITGSPSNGFYPVDWDGLAGYMFGDYLSATTQGPSDRGGSGTPDPNIAPGGDTGGVPAAGGDGSIVNFAMQYVGYPYVWAGEGPYGFDCSGFTMFVVKNVLGLNITHDMFVQYDMGAPVGRGELQPGDLVFFQNTFQFGLSHVGIYIGGGQFVHAENESTGVMVSDINSDYYSSRWYGAVRF